MSRWFAFLIIVLTVGCNQKPKAEKPAESSKAKIEEGALGALPSIDVSSKEDEVLARVGNHTLKRIQAEQDIDVRLAAVANRLPAEKVQAYRQDALGKLIEQFVIRSVLLDEAARAKIQVTEQDEKQALEKIGTFLEKQGRTLEDALAGSPLGRERMLEEVRAGVTVDKLLAERLPEIKAPTEAEVNSFKEENAARLNRPERVHAHHILLSVDADTDPSVKETHRAEAQQLQESLLAGAIFEDLARSKSDCPSSARGGDLGWFERGQMVPAFETAAFSQSTGAIGGVVESPFGFHIIRVDEHQAAGEASQVEIENLLQQRERQAAFKTFVEALLAQAKIEYSGTVTNLLPEALRH